VERVRLYGQDRELRDAAVWCRGLKDGMRDDVGAVGSSLGSLGQSRPSGGAADARGTPRQNDESAPTCRYKGGRVTDEVRNWELRRRWWCVTTWGDGSRREARAAKTKYDCE